jgi:hypothetical protein
MCKTSNNPENSLKDFKPDNGNTPPQDAGQSSKHNPTPQSQYLQLPPLPCSELEQARHQIIDPQQENLRVKKECQEAKEKSAKMKQLAENTK